MTKKQKIIFAAIVAVLVLITLVSFSLRRGEIQNGGELRGPLKSIIKPPITSAVNFDTSKWKEFDDKKVGIVIKYPESWTIQANTTDVTGSDKTMNKVYSVLLRKQQHTLIIAYKIINDHDQNYSTSNVVKNDSDFVNFQVGKYIISRSTVPEFEEEGAKSLRVCQFRAFIKHSIINQGAWCDPIVTNKATINMAYERNLLNSNNERDDNLDFDPSLLKEMDSILQHLTLE